MRKIISLVLAVSFVVLLYGCCSHSDKSVFVNSQGDTIISQRNVVIDDYGRLPLVSFSSGATVVGSEENTLRPGIKVVLTEQEITSQDFGYFTDEVNSKILLYKIVAYQEPSNSAGSKIYVTTIEKPFVVTIPTNSDTGICYLGIRESDTDPWRFSRVGAQNENAANMVFSRASKELAPKECTFNIHRLSTSFCLVVYNGENLPETIVDTLVASSTASIQVKDGKYQEDLQIKGVLKGFELGNLKPTDFRTRITYRSNLIEDAPIKVNGTKVKQTTKADSTVPGYSYYHYFLVDNVTDFSLISNNGDFNFTLNLNGVETQSFPSGFLLEFYNKIDSDSVLPYNYTEFYTFNKIAVPNETENNDKEKEDDADKETEEIEEELLYDIKYELAGGRFVIPNPTEYGESFDSFTLNHPIKDGFTFIGWTGSNGDIPQLDVVIEHGSTGEKTYTANWDTGSFRVTLTKGSGIDELSGSGLFESGSTVTVSCTTLPGYEFDFWTGNNTETTFTMPNHDVVMQANAKVINYMIEYDLKEGDIVVDNPNSYNVCSDNITLVKPTRRGYTFLGWSGTDLAGNDNLEVIIPQGSTGDREYTANWSLDTYTITCNIGEGNLPEPNPTTYDINSAAIILSNPNPQNYYIFKGWGGTELVGNENMAVTIPQGSVGNRVYTANYIPETFQINYDLQGGEAENPESYNITTLAFLLNNPTKDGYDFMGWEGSDIPEGTLSKNVIIKKGSIGDRNYVASFTARFKIKYNLNGGTVDNPTTYTAYSKAITLNNPPDFSYYKFVGWVGTGINNPTKKVVIPKGSTGDREYTAVWNTDLSIPLSGLVWLRLNKCPAGTFTMGSPVDELGREDDEIQHQVTISKDFWIGVFELTQEQYETVMGNNPSFYNSFFYSNNPVECVTWQMAKDFCNTLNATIASDAYPAGYYFDLPTEAQWEYACRAGTTTSLNNGYNLASTTRDFVLDEIGWYLTSKYIIPPYGVGGLQANNWGLSDMHGNVEEWCRDWYGEYPTTAVTDPVGPDTGTKRVLRGGSLSYVACGCRSAFRNSDVPTKISSFIGFRVALVPIPEP